MRKLILLLIMSLFISCNDDEPKKSDRNSDKILVFTKTLKFRHTASINNGISWFNQNYDAINTEHSQEFTSENLDNYGLVVFLNTTGDVLDDAQQEAFRNFIESGGSFIGIHSATDTEYDWQWYGDMVGAYFDGHPQVQPGNLRVTTSNELTSGLPSPWQRTDEWYDLRDLHPDNQYIIEIDEQSYQGGGMGEFHPIAWYKTIGSGKSFYTSMGHTGESWNEIEFQLHIRNAVDWCLN